SIILLQALILFTTAFFITTIMEHLRAREREARESARKEGEARKRLESVVDAAGAGLRLVDDRLQEVWSNSRFQAWGGGDKAIDEEARRTLEDGCGRIREHSLQDPDGRERHFATSSFAMRREDGTIHNVVQLIQDVTPMKRAQAEAMHAGKLAAIGELAGNIAHEINNPLGVISARIQLLLSRHASEFSRKPLEDLGKMRELTERISTITRGLLSYSRPARGETRVFEIRPVLERARVLVEPRAKEKNVQLDFLCPSGLPSLQGDPGELEQVIVNLALNAIDAAAGGGLVRLKAESMKDRRNSLRMTVEDNGPGIPPALRARVFEPFFSTKEDGKGTGLGLSICEGIVRGFHGTITVKDSQLGGVCFEILLPAASPPL
ncbi:MAG: sensor histidine kinase, partial [Planctomycetota bacterium]